MSNIFKLEMSLILPVLVLFGTSLFYLLASVQLRTQNMAPTKYFILSSPFFAFAAGWSFSLFNIQRFLFSEAIVFDGLSIWSFLIFLYIAFLTLAFSSENQATRSQRFPEFSFLLLNSCIGMIIVSWSNDLIVTFIGIEMASLCLYLLIALSLEKLLSKEAAFKYFVLSSFASAFLLLGISFIYGSTETTQLHKMIHILPDFIFANRLLLLGLGLVALGFCFKIAIFPFHTWTPDVYQGSPTPIAGFMAIGMKLSVFVVFLRFVGSGLLNGERMESFAEVMKWGAVLTMLTGNVVALLQKNLKRMLAYSSISHAGFMFIALIAAGIERKGVSGASSLLYYLFAYSLMTMGIFGALSLLERKASSSISIEDLRGLSLKHPWVALSMSVFLISLAGLPPMVGFSAKLLVFYAALKEELFWVSFWAAVSTVIGVYYYLRPVILMYMHKSKSEDQESSEKNLEKIKVTAFDPVSYKKFTCFFVVLCAVLVLLISIFVEPFYNAIFHSLTNIFKN